MDRERQEERRRGGEESKERQQKAIRRRQEVEDKLRMEGNEKGAGEVHEKRKEKLR